MEENDMYRNMQLKSQISKEYEYSMNNYSGFYSNGICFGAKSDSFKIKGHNYNAF